MPIYQFQNPETKEIKEVSLGMNDAKVFTDKRGMKWKRLFNYVQLKSNQHKSLRESDILQGDKIKKLVHITDEMAHAKGLKNADEYIEVNNEIIKEHKKKIPKTKKKIIE